MYPVSEPEYLQPLPPDPVLHIPDAGNQTTSGEPSELPMSVSVMPVPVMSVSVTPASAVPASTP